MKEEVLPYIVSCEQCGEGNLRYFQYLLDTDLRAFGFRLVYPDGSNHHCATTVHPNRRSSAR